MDAQPGPSTSHMFNDTQNNSTPIIHNNTNNNNNNNMNKVHNISNGTAPPTTRNEGDLNNYNKNYSDNKINMKSQRNKSLTNSSGGHSYQKGLDEWLDRCTPESTNFQSIDFSEMSQQQQQQQQQQHHSIPPANSHTAQNFLYKNAYMPYLMKPNVPDPSNYPKYFSGYSFPQQPLNSSFPSPSQHISNNILQNLNQSDFNSLPPVINMTNNHNNIRNNNSNISDDKLLSSGQDLLSDIEGRRFSDPCLAGNSSDDNDSKAASEINSQKVDSTRNSGKDSIDKRLLSKLLKQIDLLHETNTKICRNLYETKVEIEALKHAPTWGLRHRRDSISGLSTHSQPLGGFAYGTQSPAPTFHSGAYTPGMLTDVVREVKEAARVREEALLSRVRALVEERSWSINETNLKVIRDIEEIKIQLHHFKSDKTESNMRITKLEDDIKSIRSLVTHTLSYNNNRSSMHGNTTSHLTQSNSFNERDYKGRSGPGYSQSMSVDAGVYRKKRQSLNLHYGTIHQENDPDYQTNDDDEIIYSGVQPFSEIRKEERLKLGGGGRNSKHSGMNNNNHGYSTTDKSRHFNSDQIYRSASNSNSTGSINGGGGGGGGGNGGGGNGGGGNGGGGNGGSNNNNNDAINDRQNDGQIVQMEKDTLELRRELQDALDCKKSAETKILDLENVVKNLQQKLTISTPTNSNPNLSNGGSGILFNNSLNNKNNHNNNSNNNNGNGNGGGNGHGNNNNNNISRNMENFNKSTSCKILSSSSASSSSTSAVANANVALKPQLASQIQTIMSPKLLMSNTTIGLTGPVTDL